MTTLIQLSERIQSQPLRDRVTAEFVRVAGTVVRDDTASPERKTWAQGVLLTPDQSVNSLVLNIFYTNATISASLDANSSGDNIPDADIEYVVVAEILPLISPA